MVPLRLGVDLGGTKIEAAVVRLGEAAPEVLVRRRVPTLSEQGYEHVVATAAKLILEVAKEAGLPSPPPIGVGMPGSITTRGPRGIRSPFPLTKNSNTTCLNDRPFRHDLQRSVGHAIAFDNDANCFALAEATYGAARGARVVFGVILGTGVGGGIVFRQGDALRTWDGAQGIAGEWGHVCLDPIDGPPCYCGRRGCVEQYLKGPAIEAAYERRTGSRRPLAELARRAATEPDVRAVLDEMIEHFGRALGTVINILDPDIVVLGGGVSNLDVFYEKAPAAVARWTFNDELATRIVKHSLGDSAGVFGAALLP